MNHLDKEARKRQIFRRFLVLLAAVAAALWGAFFYLTRESGQGETASSSSAASSADASSTGTSGSSGAADVSSSSEAEASTSSGAEASISSATEASASSATEATPTPTLTPTPAPTPAIEPLPWNLILVNDEHRFTQDLEIPAVEEIYEDVSIDSRARDDLAAFLGAAWEEGLQPIVVSSFRTWEEQEALFEADIMANLEAGMSEEEAEAAAAHWVSRPGASEHQLGLALDIVDDIYQELDEAQEYTPVQQWLLANCWDYGFILRYPRGKEEITGIGYEPWHYRYVGREAAAEIRDLGICLEEYVELKMKEAEGAEGESSAESSAEGAAEESSAAASAANVGNDSAASSETEGADSVQDAED